jgi:hypothetical protein
MSTVTGGQGNIVTNGLMLWLDAANPRSYPQPYNGTTWTNLSGNNNSGSLTNGPTYTSTNGGSIVFDGVDDFTSLTLNTGSFTTEATLMMFLKLTNATPTLTSQTGIERLSASNTKEASHYPWVDGTAYLGTFQPSTRINSIILSSTILRTNWHMITITSSPGSGNWKFYQNTQLIRTAVGPSTVFFSSDAVYNIARGQGVIAGPLYHFNGNIANVMLYNRALSDQEIAQNFNATRARFGI